MRKKINIICIILVCVILSSLFFYINFDNYKLLIERITQIKKPKELQTFFDLQDSNLNNGITKNFENLKSGFTSFFSTYFSSFKTFFSGIGIIFKWMGKIFLFALQYGTIILSFVLMLYVAVYIFLSSENKSYRYSKFAKMFWSFNLFIYNKYLKIKIFIKSYCKKYKKCLKRSFIIILFSSYLLPKIIVEVVIFLIVYVISLLDLSTFEVIFPIFKFLIYYVYMFFKKTPLIISILTCYVIIYFICIHLGYARLKKNHNHKKNFVKHATGQTTILNGAPGTGKTVNVVDMALMAEEIYIDELEEEIFNFETNNPILNMALFRLLQDVEDKKVVYDLLSSKTKKMLAKFKLQLDEIDTSDLIVSYDKLNNRPSYIVSNFSMVDPYFDGVFSHKLYMDMLKLYQKQDSMALESYMVLAFTEIDKEFNSFIEKTDVDEEGASAFMGVVSQACDRKVKVFMDYQVHTLLKRSFRANAESFIVLRSLDIKCCKSVVLIKKPFDWFYKIVRSITRLYEGKKNPVEKKHTRIGKFKYKRNDYTLFYGILRALNFICNKIDNYFSRFYYMIHKGKIADNDEMQESNDFKTYTNIWDLSYNNDTLFDSCFFGQVYDDLRDVIGSKKQLRDIPHWTSKSPSLKEYLDLNMRIYKRLYDAQIKDKKEEVNNVVNDVVDL